MTVANSGYHRLTLSLPVLDLGCRNIRLLKDLVSQMHGFNRIGRAVVGASRQVIKRVFQFVVFRLASPASADSAQNDRSIWQFGYFICLDHNSAIGKVNGERLCPAKTLGRPRTDQSLNQSVREQTILRRIRVVDWS